MVKQDQLIIYLASHAVSPSWVLVDKEEVVKETVMDGDPSLLAQLAAEKNVIVLVPAEDVLLTSAKLPKMNHSRLLQALPFALEEQVIADVDTLHFAPLANQAEEMLPVAIVAKEKMQCWLSQLQTWQVKADVLIPLSLALPYADTRWDALIEQMVTVRTGPFSGFACDQANFPDLLSMSLQASEVKPQVIHIHSCQDTDISTITLPASIIEDKVNTTKLLAFLASSAIHFSGNHLLQGEYAVKKSRFPQRQKMWKAAAILAISWLVILFLYPTVSYFVLKTRLSKIENQMSQIYRYHFPQASSMVAPKLRMEEKLQKMAAGSGENRLLLLLAFVGKGLSPADDINLKRFDFQNNQLTLDVSAASSEHFAAFTNYLSQQGLRVKQQNATLINSRINATLTVE